MSKNIIKKTKASRVIFKSFDNNKPKNLSKFLKYDFRDRCEYIKIEKVDIIRNIDKGNYMCDIHYKVIRDFNGWESVDSMFKKALNNYYYRVYVANYDVDLEEMFDVI